jgi:hypothetical protein
LAVSAGLDMMIVAERAPGRASAGRPGRRLPA